jgi:hypothetical protein
MTKLFVCYGAVTASTERFCQNAEIRPDRTGWRPRGLVGTVEPHGRARQEPLVAAKFDLQVASPEPGRHRLGPVSTLRCDQCRQELGSGVHRYWGMQFCSSACMTAYQQRLAPETKVKICRLDVLPSEGQISDSNLSQPRVSWPTLWDF